jgi:hypothetical protein
MSVSFGTAPLLAAVSSHELIWFLAMLLFSVVVIVIFLK